MVEVQLFLFVRDTWGVLGENPSTVERNINRSIIKDREILIVNY